MTIASVLVWSALAFGLTIAGAKGGALLMLSRAIDNLRAAVLCGEFCWRAAADTWRNNWGECQRWARASR